MTPEEFRQSYLSVQDSLGNNLQTLTILSSDFGSILEDVVADYRSLNEIVDQFLREQNISDTSSNQDFGQATQTSSPER